MNAFQTVLNLKYWQKTNVPKTRVLKGRLETSEEKKKMLVINISFFPQKCFQKAVSSVSLKEEIV